MAREEARDLDQRWQRLIRANRSGNDGAREEPSVIQAAPIQDNGAYFQLDYIFALVYLFIIIV